MEMEKEIERKFLVKEMPDLTGLKPLHYERYFIQRGLDVEERVQKKGNIFEREKKVTISSVESKKEKEIISENVYNELKERALDAIIRDAYLLQMSPNVSLKIYGGRFNGLVRAEVEFTSIEEANAFIPFAWMGKEITDSPLGRDSKLIDLAENQFQELIRLENAT